MSRNRSHRNTNANQIASHPQDHKQSKNTVRRVNVRGIDIGIDPKVLDDWEFMESLYDLQADPKGNALQIIPFLRRLLGDSYDTRSRTDCEAQTGASTAKLWAPS